MQEEDRKALRSNREALLKDLEAKRVASLLYSREIFSEEDKDSVNAKSTPAEQREEVLDILPRKGPKAFSAFCNVLHEVSPHLEALLRPTQEDDEDTDGPGSSTAPIPASGVPSEEFDEVDSPPGPGSPELDHSSGEHDDILRYKMSRSPRGIAVIINNKKFLESSGQHMAQRGGTDIDRDALNKLFKKLQFKVEVHNNQTKAEILRIVREKATSDHSLYDAFIFAILTHGEEGLVYGIDGTLRIREITSKFKNNKTLAGKPKIFFFQACQENNDQADAKLFSFGGGGSAAKSSANTIDNDTIYKMNKSTRGIAVIINNKDFLRSSGMDRYPRNGTDVDRDALAKLFRALKFDVRIYNNQTRAEIRRITKEMAITNHSPYDAFIFSILTHGEEGVIYGTDGTMAIKDLTAIFKDCATLVGKPKMFFFQACQGHEYMDGMDVTDAPQQGSKVSVPAEADFVYAYSTVPGYYSWRNSVNGSWFIQSLTKVFEENAERMDILRMLTRVNAMVSTYKSRTGDYYSDSKRQVSSVVSMLRKELYFFPENVTDQS